MNLGLNLSISKKLILAFSSIAFLFFLFGAFALNTIGKIKVNGPLYEQIISKKDLVADILPPPAYIIESYLCTMNIATAEQDAGVRKELLKRLETLYSGEGYYTERVEYWKQHLSEQNIRDVFFNEAVKNGEQFYSIALGPFATAVRQEDEDQLRDLFYKQLSPAYERHRQAIDRVVNLANERFVQIETNAASVVSWRRTAMIISFFAVVFCSLLFGLLIARSISRPINHGVSLLEKVAAGDLTVVIPDAMIARKDEVGNLYRSLKEMALGIRDIITDVNNSVHVVNSSTGKMSEIGRKMSDGASNTSALTQTVATASEEVSSNISSVAAATEEAATNVEIVSSSAEEITITIHDIVQTTEKTKLQSQVAVEKSQGASVKIDELGSAANEVGKVTDAITEISEQTNLLALNATIEAARAGEAGKGFAVVANEIKELAKQTAEATTEIQQQIEGIQRSTLNSVDEIKGITELIVDVNEMIVTVAAAVEQQAATLEEVSGNVGQASVGLQEITENISQGSSVIDEMNADIAKVNQATSDISSLSDQVDKNIADLNETVVSLQKVMARFVI